MLALVEKPRVVVVLAPHLLLNGSDAHILATFQDAYLEVKARKEICFTPEDAHDFFHYQNPELRGSMVETFTSGLSMVVVLEHLEKDALSETVAQVMQLDGQYGQGNIYCSQTVWETARDMEYFFPHVAGLPVERTLVVLKPDGLARGDIHGKTLEEDLCEHLVAADLYAVARRELYMEPTTAEVLCMDMAGTPDYENAISVLLQEPGVVAMIVEGPGAVSKLSLACGPTSCSYARDRAPRTLRARWGTDSSSNAIHCSSTVKDAEAEIALLFPKGCLQLQRSLLLVKPEAMEHLLEIRGAIDDWGFTVLKEKQTKLTEERAKEFYQAYKEKPSFAPMVRLATAGPCHVFVLCRLEALNVIQQLAGPESVREAKSLQPMSLRARFGLDDQRNAVHCSSTVKVAGREIHFFFPEMGLDPAPNEAEVRDFIFRKSAGASRELKTLAETDNVNPNVDQTLQQLLSKGLMALCQVQPKGLAAVKWLSRWLEENNPNTVAKSEEEAGLVFKPPDRVKRYVEHGVNQDGMAFMVEAPPEAPKKEVIDVDVSDEPEDTAADFHTPPFVVFVVGGPGSGKGTQCAKLSEDFNLVHLSTGDLMRAEVAAQTFLGTEMMKCMQAGTLVPDKITLQLLKKAMVKHQDSNRFLIDGFPRSLEQAKLFEQTIAEVAFVLYFEASNETMKKRIEERAVKAPGRVDDNPEVVQKRLETYEEQTMPVIEYYEPIGKIRKVNAEKEVDEVHAETRELFCCRFIYLVGPPGSPLEAVADRLEERYGYSAIKTLQLLQTFAESNDPEAPKVKQALQKGRPVEASILCPLILRNVFRDMALGVQSFVICDFPQSLKQARFLEHRVPCKAQTIMLDFAKADAEDLSALTPPSNKFLNADAAVAMMFGEESQNMLKELPDLVRIPCSLSQLDMLHKVAKWGKTMDAEQQFIEQAWEGVHKVVIPNLTLVLGPPGCGAGTLTHLLARLTPNTYAVDCNQLLDKELERRTAIGTTMHDMLARGQVVPLSTTLELLKSIVNLTCSSSLVIENCPLYADQLPYILKDFRIDRAFYIRGSNDAVKAWKDKFIANGDPEEAENNAKVFDERLECLPPIVTHFARMGRLETFDVDETPNERKLRKMVEQLVEEEPPPVVQPQEEEKPKKDEGEDAEEADEGDEEGEEGEEQEKVVVPPKPKPKIFAIMAPQGNVGFSGVVADAICTSKVEGTRPTKYIVVDCAAVFTPGGHSDEMEEKLHKALLTCGSPERLPIPIRAELLTEAFDRSANPQGTFILINFPTVRGADIAIPPLRDQLMMLDSVCTISGLIHVKLADSAFLEWCEQDPEALSAYQIHTEQVHDGILMQFGSVRLCSLTVEKGMDSLMEARRIAGDILRFLEEVIEANRVQ